LLQELRRGLSAPYAASLTGLPLLENLCEDLFLYYKAPWPPSAG